MAVLKPLVWGVWFIDVTFAVAKRKPEKIQACTGGIRALDLCDIVHRYRSDQEFKSSTSLNFFRLSFRNCKSCVYKCDDLLSYNYIYFIRLNTISVFSGIPILMCLRFLSNTIKTVM